MYGIPKQGLTMPTGDVARATGQPQVWSNADNTFAQQLQRIMASQQQPQSQMPQMWPQFLAQFQQRWQQPQRAAQAPMQPQGLLGAGSQMGPLLGQLSPISPEAPGLMAPQMKNSAFRFPSWPKFGK